MSGSTQRPPSGEPWVWMTRELLTSAAWQALSINGRRVIDWLLIEHMRHGGRRNGFLLAPWRQLGDFGIGTHFISGAIEEIQQLGLVDCKRGVGRRPSTYTLTWLPQSDGSPPSNRFIGNNSSAAAIVTARKEAKRRKSFAVRHITTAQTAVNANACTNSTQTNCQTAVTKARWGGRLLCEALNSKRTKMQGVLCPLSASGRRTAAPEQTTMPARPPHG
jgi:hypothetical protein